jgi:EmrB/QacA subfamily drug resistance transporter
VTPRPLAIASVGAFVAALSTSLVAVSVPVVARELGVTPRDVSWVLSAYLLTISALLAFAGKAADVLGRKRVYLTGFVFFVAGSAMCASAPTFRALVGSRVLQGVGAAMLMAIGPAIVTRAVPPARRARGLGIQLATTYVGSTLGPGLGGLLAARIGWQAVFVVIAGAGAIGTALAAFLLPPDDAKGPVAEPGSLDVGGAVLFAFALVGLLLGLKLGQDAGWTSRSFLALAAFSAVSFAVFLRHESLHRTPVLPLGLLRHPPFALGIAGAILLYTATFMLAYLLPFQLQHGLGLGPASAGALMTAQPAAMAIFAPLSGVLSDRWGPRIPSVAGMAAIACGLLGIGWTGRSAGVPLIAALVVVGAGAGLYVAPNSALIMGSAPRDRQGIAGAMTATARNLGMTLGIAIAASVHHSLAFAGGIIVAAALAAGGVVLALARPVSTP